MAGDTTSNIFINVDTSQAMAQLRALEKELTALNRSLIVGTKAAAAAQSKYAQSLLHNVNATGQWTASMTRMSTASEQFATKLDRQKLSLKEYFRYGMASTKTFGKMFGNEFDTVSKLVDRRVKTLQQQYIQLGRDAQGAMNAMKFSPKALNYGNVTTQLMMATQRQQIFNKLVDDGATKLLNFGKNTQWAGRQLMVGFTIPLMLFGSQAIKTFKEIETQVIRFKKVYGDIFTDQGATDAALKNIRALADEYTKYGLKVSETIKMAADAAAAGFSGEGLQTVVEQTNKLAVLGGIAQDKALETTIALKNAFQIDNSKMAGTIDFLNAVENQTVVALDDLTTAIPKVAPVIQQLGGDVKDLAYFMAAMQEGGISAAQGANALKSGLASLINPSKKAAAAAQDLGINIKGIVEANAGNLRNTVTAFAKALQPLTDLQRSRIIEQVFGKFQFARISALLNNIGREGTQAARVLQLTNASAEELAILSKRELKIQAESSINKFTGAVERLKKSLAPIGEVFAKVLTPVLEFLTKMFDKFNNLPEGVKKAIGTITVIVGGLGPVFLMTFGLIANAIANSVKGIQVLRKGYQQLSAGSTDAGLKTQYLTQEELENISISNALYSKHQQLSAAYELEATALASLANVYKGASVAMGAFASSNPGLFMPGRGITPRRFADGTNSVPGPAGAGDVVPSMLSPGEAVIPVKQSKKYAGFISQIIADKVPGFVGGRYPSLFGHASNLNAPIRGITHEQIREAAAKFNSMSAQEQEALLARRRMGMGLPMGKPIASNLPGITYSADGSLIRISVGDESFLISPSKLGNLKTKLQENEEWMIAQGRKDNTEQELLRTIKRKGFGGKEISPSQIYSRLPKFSHARNSQQNQSIADKRFRALVKAQNPHLLKLQNYLQNEEKVFLESVLPKEVISSLKGWDVNKLTPSHIREVRSQNRTAEDWAPNKIARDWGWFNSALRGTKFGNVTGGHPLNSAQARELLNNLKTTPFDKLSNEKKALQAVLEYRLARRPSYYDDFIFTDNAMMKVKPMRLAEGIFSVPGPKGAGDIQPAMLSPGEAVIPAKQSEKYMPLIRSMIADNIPGFEGSNVGGWSGNPGSWRTTPTPPLIDSWGDPVTEPATSKTRLKNALTSIVRDKDIAAVKNFGKETAKAAKESKVAAKAMDGIKRTASSAAKSLSSTDVAAKGVTQSFGTDKTRGFRGFLAGYGNVSQNIVDANGVTRAATAAERTNMRQMNRMNFTNKMMPAQMLGMAVPMAAGMYAQKNPESGIAKSMDLIMMLSMLTMLLPMLNSPLKLLAATAVGLIAVFKLQASTIKKNIIEGQKQAEAMTMTSKRLEELGTITGRVSTTQVAQAKRAGRTTEIVPVSMEFGQNILRNSDFGKNLQASFTDTMNRFGENGANIAVESLANQLSTAVSQGVLTAVQAESIGIALTRDLKDARLELNLRGRLNEIIGPNGQDILNNPVDVQMNLIASGKKLQEAALDNLNLVAKQQVGINKSEALQMGGAAVPAGIVAARAGVQAARMFQGGVGASSLLAQEAAIAKAGNVGKIGTALRVARAARVAGTVGSAAVGTTGVGAPAALVGAAVSTVIFGGIEAALRGWQKGKEKAAIGKAAGQFQGILSQNLIASQQSIDALNAQYDSAIANLELKKKIAKTEKERSTIDDQIKTLEGKRATGLKDIRKSQADMIASAASSYDKVSGQSLWERVSPLGSGRGQVRDKYMEAFKVSMQEKFKGTPQAGEVSLLQSQLDKLGKDKVTVEISTLVTSDVLTPNEASTLLSTLTKSGQDIEKTINTIVTAQGTEGLQRLSTILTFIPSEENKKQLLIDISKKNKTQADATLAGIEELIKIPNYIGIMIDLETGKKDLGDLMKLGTEIGQLKKLIPDGQISLDVLTKVQQDLGKGTNITLDNAIKQWDLLSKLPKNLQFQAMITLSTLKASESFDTIVNREISAAYGKKYPNARRVTKDMLDRFAKANPEIQKAAEEAAMIQTFGIAPTDTSKNGNSSSTGTGAKRDMSWLNDLGQKLKLFKEGAFNALDPLNEIRKYFGKDFGAGTINPMLAQQAGALKEIEQAAKDAGIVLSEDFMGVIRQMDPEQFKLWSATLFKISKDGRITGLKDDFIAINRAMTTNMAGEYIDSLKTASKEVENQVKAYDILSKAGYNQLEIEKLLQNQALTASIANRGFLSLSIEERRDLNAEINKTINLNQKQSEQKLDFNIGDLKAQVDAYKKLKDAKVSQDVINEILKDKSNAWAISSTNGVEELTTKYGPLITKTQEYLNLLKFIENATKTFEQKTQDAIDANMAALDLQARTLQNEFDKDNFDLKVKIRLKDDEIKAINKTINDKQDEIEAINFKLKYDPKIGQGVLDSLQEQIKDAQRNIEFNFDRPLQALSDRSEVLSNDLAIMDHAATAINEKYDAQEKALTKISEINADIAAQEKNRISLADALSQGDISAAAQMAQEMRAGAAASAARMSGDYLTAAREAELGNLRSSSGMTRKQIEEEQYAIGQRSYALEQQRKEAQAAILVIEDKIYNINAAREPLLNNIKDLETQIDGIKNNELLTAQNQLDVLQAELDKNQAILDLKLDAIAKEKLGWDSVQLKLDAYKAKLTEINNGPLATMKSVVDAILLALEQAKSNAANFNTGSGNAALLAKQKQYDADLKSLNALKSIGGYVYEAAKKDFDSKYPTGRPMQYGGLVPKYMANGGFAIGSDTIPAMLSPGEFIVNKNATKAFLPQLKNINNSAYPSMLGSLTPPSFLNQMSNVTVSSINDASSVNSINDNSSTVYNYRVNINVDGSNSGPDDIARAVMTQIQYIDAQRIRKMA